MTKHLPNPFNYLRSITAVSLCSLLILAITTAPVYSQVSECAELSHNKFSDFNRSGNPGTATTIWLNVHIKLKNTQLTNDGDYILFYGGKLSFNGIGTSFGSSAVLPEGKVVADNSVSAPTSSFDKGSNTWITRVPLAYSSPDLFIAGAAITSTTGFTLSGGSKSTQLKGYFYSNDNDVFSSSWFYGMACYQPTFTNSTVGNINSIGSGRKAGTPIDQASGLVAGGSGGGGSNYTGSYSSTDNFTSCVFTMMGDRTALTTNHANTAGALLFPNPSMGSAALLQFYAAAESMYTVTISDLAGRPVLRKNYKSTKGLNTYQLNLDNLNKGIYIVTLYGNDHKEVLKVTRQ